MPKNKYNIRFLPDPRLELLIKYQINNIDREKSKSGSMSKYLIPITKDNLQTIKESDGIRRGKKH